MHNNVLSDKKAFSLMLLFVMFFSVAFSSLLIAKQINHDCTGAECEICDVISSFDEIIRQPGYFHKTAHILIPIARTLLVCICSYIVAPFQAPVFLKVRIND